jgi:hypothetical protein
VSKHGREELCGQVRGRKINKKARDERPATADRDSSGKVFNLPRHMPTNLRAFNSSHARPDGI